MTGPKHLPSLEPGVETMTVSAVRGHDLYIAAWPAAEQDLSFIYGCVGRWGQDPTLNLTAKDACVLAEKIAKAQARCLSKGAG